MKKDQHNFFNYIYNLEKIENELHDLKTVNEEFFGKNINMEKELETFHCCGKEHYVGDRCSICGSD